MGVTAAWGEGEAHRRPAERGGRDRTTNELRDCGNHGRGGAGAGERSPVEARRADDHNTAPGAAFAATLLRWRRARKMSQSALANQMGYDRSYVSQMESGRQAPTEDFARRADAVFQSDGTLWRLWCMYAAERGEGRRPAHMQPESPRHQDGYRTPPPSQLPHSVVDFVGRDEQLAQLKALVESGGHRTGSVLIVTIAGAGGVGKTALALHWAHQLRDLFPDGNLFADLRGFSSDPRLDPAEVLDTFLRGLGVPPEDVPGDARERATLFRSVLADRRVIILLDNAATAEQVRPLLPGASRSLVLVTSRDRLKALRAFDGACSILLGPLAEQDTVTLLRKVAGASRAGDEAEQWNLLARSCGGHPLTARMLADHAAHHPFTPLEEMAIDVEDGRPGIWRLLATAYHGPTSLQNAFALSYDALPSEAARLFRLLGLHPGVVISSPAAAVLSGREPRYTRGLLELLADVSLLEIAGQDRYRFHDLLRAYADDLAHATETVAEVDAARHRLLLWYLGSAAAAQRMIAPDFRAVTRYVSPHRVNPKEFADAREAVKWCEAEGQNLLAAARVAAAAGLDDMVWRFPEALQRYHIRRQPYEEWIALGELGLAAALRTDDAYGQAEMHNTLGVARVHLRDYEASLRHHSEALALRRRLSDEYGVSVSLNNLGFPYLKLRRFGDAQSCFTDAVTQARRIGDRGRQQISLLNLGHLENERSRPAAAIEPLLESLAIAENLQNGFGERAALGELSCAYAGLGRVSDATEAVQRGLAITVHELPAELAYVLSLFGRALCLPGHLESALGLLCDAELIFHDGNDRQRRAKALTDIGRAQQALHHLDAAAETYRLAADLHEAEGDYWRYAETLWLLGDVLVQQGRAEAARWSWEEGLVQLKGLTDPAALELRRCIAHTLSETPRT
ncbi:tetratricopeptide repeat protein [Streptomyces sp. SL13]|uniref:Tetratricopeptide repeat protein n=1 Tax=Streptantibioticus silvisoli TaxID=2705255 RepID=A0AA90H8W5_9ACTN|nr:helix-turn-helix domain-containing protein [Streptantibioticus silvisoli]MDI5974061.1 tetratricopeptide repeat protein [Streptantibioticus silvisoli]